MANMFNEDGTYNKTEWKAGDKITAVKLNKIELSLEAINNNDIDRHVEADSRLDALEAKDVEHDEEFINMMTSLEGEFTNIKNTIEDNKAASELGDYEINSKMTSLEGEFTNIKNTIEDNKAALELGDYEINSKMTSLEGEFNEGMVEVNTRVTNLISEIDRVSSELINIRAELNNLINELNSIVVLDIT